MNPWRKSVEDYIQMRRSLGYKLHDAHIGLLNFAAFLEARGAPHLTTPLAMQWAQQDPEARPAEWARRLSFVRGFARYWSAQDSKTEIPPWGLLPPRPGRARPYLYSDDEVRRLLCAAQQLPSAHGLRGRTYHCLLGLLSVTGLRISEALNLQCEDVDLREGILTVRGTKFGKSRLVPIHPLTRKVLSDYAWRRDRFPGVRPAPAFSCPNGERGSTAAGSGGRSTTVQTSGIARCFRQPRTPPSRFSSACRLPDYAESREASLPSSPFGAPFRGLLTN